MKYLCGKLVPGQVVRLPANHSTLKNTKLVEIVTRLEDDEFERPWVFDSIEQAKMSDPSLSNLPVEQIMSGLALTQGTAASQRRKLEEREAAKLAEAEGEDDEDGETVDSSAEELDDEALLPISERERQKRASNRLTLDEKEEIVNPRRSRRNRE